MLNKWQVALSDPVPKALPYLWIWVRSLCAEEICTLCMDEYQGSRGCNPGIVCRWKSTLLEIISWKKVAEQKKLIENKKKQQNRLSSPKNRTLPLELALWSRFIGPCLYSVLNPFMPRTILGPSFYFGLGVYISKWLLICCQSTASIESCQSDHSVYLWPCNSLCLAH